MKNFCEQEVRHRIGLLGKLGHLKSTADFFCLRCFNQLSKWLNPKSYFLVRCSSPRIKSNALRDIHEILKGPMQVQV